MNHAKLRRNLLVLALAASAAIARAGVEREVVDGVEWTYMAIDGKARVGGDFDAEDTAVPVDTAGRLSIPSVLGGHPVTDIGPWAFAGCWDLTGVTIPDGVTNIDWCAFQACAGLEEMDIPGSVATIDWNAFSDCGGMTNLTLRNGLSVIGDSAFSGCSGLAGVAVPDSVVRIGKNAFEKCSGLAGVSIGAGVASIGNDAFAECSRLASVRIPAGTADIGPGAFSRCGGLEAIEVEDGNAAYGSVGGVLFDKSGKTLVQYPAGRSGAYGIPAGTETVRSHAFDGCGGLTGVTVPESVGSVGEDAFRNCGGLREVRISDLAAWCGIDFANERANPLSQALDLYVGDEPVTEIAVPDGVTAIGGHAFDGWAGLTGVTVPASVGSIGEDAFRNCGGLREVRISDLAAWCGIVFANERANPLSQARDLYVGDELITEMALPDGVTRIKWYAFAGCSALSSVSIPGSVKEIGLCAFRDCSGLVDVAIANGPERIGNWAFAGCGGLTNMLLPASVVDIGMGMFSGCGGLTHMEIPDGIGGIPWNAFQDCGGLTNVSLPDGLSGIGKWAFAGCTGLAALRIPDGVETIGPYAFSGCTGLETLFVPTFWQGVAERMAMLEKAQVPEGCRIVYGEPETSATPVPVPHAWLERNAAEALAAAGGDYETAAMAPAANGRKIWECYVAGLSPESGGDFKAEIAWKDGVPSLSPSVELEGRTYTWEGAEVLGGEEVWGPVDAASRFFRVKAALAEKGPDDFGPLRWQNGMSSLTILTNLFYEFRIAGGKSPYTWELNGVGELESAKDFSKSRVYRAGPVPGNATLTVTDGTAGTISVRIDVRSH